MVLAGDAGGRVAGDLKVPETCGRSTRRRCERPAEHPEVAMGAVGFHWAVNP